MEYLSIIADRLKVPSVVLCLLLSSCSQPAVDFSYDPATHHVKSSTALTIGARTDSGVMINEIVANPSTGGDWVELKNLNSSPLDLSGYKLSDEPWNLSKYTVPNGTSIPALGFIVIYFGTAVADSLSTTFSLSDEGEAVVLSSPSGEVVDYISFSTLEIPSVKSVTNSYGRPGSSNKGARAVFLKTVTKGKENSVALGTQPTVGSGIVINEWLAANSLGSDWIELYNRTSSAIDLGSQKYSLCRRRDDIESSCLTFPSPTRLAAKGFLVIAADGTENSPGLNTPFNLNRSGDSITLKRNGIVYDYQSFGPQTVDLSQGIAPDGTRAQPVFFERQTPGASNSSPAFRTLAREAVIINEWMALNKDSVIDPSGGSDDEHDDWIELHNPGSAPIDLGGFSLSNNLSDKQKFTFAAGTTIAPGGYLVLWADEQPEQNTTDFKQIHLPFNLNSDGDSIVLSHPSGFVVDGISFTAQGEDLSEGRTKEEMGFVQTVFSTPTPGSANKDPLALLNSGTVVINEWMVQNSSAYADPTDKQFEPWIELYNKSFLPIQLAGYELFESRSGFSYSFPAGTIIQPRGYLLVWADNEPTQNNGPKSMHAPFILSTQGGTIVLKHQSGQIIDTIDYTNALADKSEGRTLDGRPLPAIIQSGPSPLSANLMPLPNLAADLTALYPDIDQNVLLQKARLASSGHSFFRSFVSYFYYQLNLHMAEIPVAYQNRDFGGWCLGDAHIENFGAILDRKNKAMFTMNDTDDAGPCPLVVDVLRFLTSAYLSNIDIPIYEIIWAYRDGLKDLNTEQDYKDWVEEFLEDSEDDGVRAMRNYVDYDNFVFVDREDLAPVDASLRSEIEAIVNKTYGDKLTVKDIKQRVKITGGSGGLARFEVLTALGNGNLPFHLEIKQVVAPGIQPVATARIPTPAQRLALSLLVEQDGRHSPFYTVKKIRGVDYLIRPRFAGNNNIDLAEYDEDEAKDIILNEAWQMGALHMRAADKPTDYRERMLAIPTQVWTDAAYELGKIMKSAYFATTSLRYPNSLRYAAGNSVGLSTSVLKYNVGSLIPMNIPLYTGTKSTGIFKAVPDLPSGLFLHPTTGAITGTPLQVSSRQTYEIQISGDPDIVQKLSIEVGPALPVVQEPPATATVEPALPIVVYSNKEILSHQQRTEVDLGTVEVGKEATAQPFMVKNVSRGAVTISNIFANGSLMLASPVTSEVLRSGDKSYFFVRHKSEKLGDSAGVVGFTYVDSKNVKRSFLVHAGGLVVGTPPATSSNSNTTTTVVASPSPGPSPSPAPASGGKVTPVTTKSVEAIAADLSSFLTTQPNANFPEYGGQIAALAMANTRSQYEAIRTKLSRTPNEKLLKSKLTGSLLKDKIDQLVQAANLSEYSQGARKAAVELARELNPSSPEILKIVVEICEGVLSPDRQGQARGMLLATVSRIQELQPALQKKTKQWLVTDAVKGTFKDLGATGRIHLRTMILRAFLASRASLKTSLEVLNPLLKNLEPQAQHPLIKQMIYNFPELTYGLHDGDSFVSEN